MNPMADPMTVPTPADDLAAGRTLADNLGLQPLALEGGLFRRTFTGGERPRSCSC